MSTGPSISEAAMGWLCPLEDYLASTQQPIPAEQMEPSLRRQIHKWLVLNPLMITLRLGGRCLYPVSPFSGPCFILKSHSVSCLIFPSHSQGNDHWAGHTSISQEACGISGNKIKPEASSDGSLQAGLAVGSHHRCLPS